MLLKKKHNNIKKINKIEKGKITYSDLNKPSRALFSRRYCLAGKPDYIVNQNGSFYPVEYKTGVHNNPMKNHIIQVAAYCELVEENYDNFVSHGILVYNNKNSFKIPYNPALRFELENAINKMRYIVKTKNIARNHNNASRCKNCSMRKYCDKKII